MVQLFKKKNTKGYKQHLVSSGGDGSVGRSAYDRELFVLTPFPDLKEWGYILSELGEVAPGVRLRVQQAVAKAFMGCVGA